MTHASPAPYEKSTLANGLRVLTIPMPGVRSVTVMVMAAVGSRYESRRENGIAHFMEHMFFKGALRYPDTMAVSSAIDGVGGVFNAFTSEEKVAYFVKLSSAKKRIAFDVLSDMLINSRFDADEIERERGVIVEEIRMYQDDPMSKVQIDFKRHFYGDQPLGWDIAGPEENIRAVTRRDFLAFLDEHYAADNLVLVAAGDITHDENVSLAREFFTFTRRRGKKPAPPFAAPTGGVRSILTKREIEQAHFIIGFPAPGDEHADQPALKVFNNAFGGTMSSRLFHQVRERRGLAYYVRSGRSAYTDTGAIKISAGVNVAKLEEAIACVMEEVAKAAAEGLTADEVAKAKENIKGRLDLSLEDSMSMASLIAGREALHGAVKTPEELVAEIDAVTEADVARVAATYLDRTKAKLGVLGPYDDIVPFDAALGS
ncbi:MAG: insulinase family protein [Nitrospinae bacterium]|nr:insulinase family protein [Nitrospinota bacterium]